MLAEYQEGYAHAVCNNVILHTVERMIRDNELLESKGVASASEADMLRIAIVLLMQQQTNWRGPRVDNSHMQPYKQLKGFRDALVDARRNGDSAICPRAPIAVKRDRPDPENHYLDYQIEMERQAAQYTNIPPWILGGHRPFGRARDSR